MTPSRPGNVASRSFHVRSTRPPAIVSCCSRRSGGRTGRASRAARAASRRARSRRGPPCRARPGGRSSCARARAAAPSRSSAPRTPRTTRRRGARARRRRCWRSGSAPPRRDPRRAAARPRRSGIDDSPTAVARGSTVRRRPSRACSSATSTVISFVIEAIGDGPVAARAAQHLAGRGVLDDETRRGDVGERLRRRGGAGAASATATTSAARAGSRSPTPPLYWPSGDAQPLADVQRGRADAGVEALERLDADAGLAGDHLERVAGDDDVVARRPWLPLGRLRRRLLLRRRDRRRRLRAPGVVRVQRRRDQDDRDRDRVRNASGAA